jgi:hypothetical protein
MTENSSISLTILGFLILYGGGAIYSFACLKTKVDTILKRLDATTEAQNELKKEISAVEHRVTVLEGKVK